MYIVTFEEMIIDSYTCEQNSYRYHWEERGKIFESKDCLIDFLEFSADCDFRNVKVWKGEEIYFKVDKKITVDVSDI